MSDDEQKKLEDLIAELHGHKNCPRYEEQLRENVVPSYLLAEYNRLATASEIMENYPENTTALCAVSFAALKDESEMVRMRCLLLIANSDWFGLEEILIICTFDSHADIRLLALEAMAARGFPCLKDVAKRMVHDSDTYVCDLAIRLDRGDKSYPIYEFSKV
ncbi:MAG: hypothetical protein U0798_18675 [Gemmataceae bacterium]